MTETKHVANISSVILDEFLSEIKHFLALVNAVSHHSLIKYVKDSGLIVQSK